MLGAASIAMAEARALVDGHDDLRALWRKQDSHMDYLAWRRERAEQVAQALRNGERTNALLSDTIRELEQNGYPRLQIRDGLRLWIAS